MAIYELCVDLLGADGARRATTTRCGGPRTWASPVPRGQLAQDVPAGPGQLDRGRHLRDPAEHPRRTRARPARRAPRSTRTSPGRRSRGSSPGRRTGAARHTEPVPPPSPCPPVRARPAAIAAVFVANGLVGPSFLPRLPERQAGLGLSDAGLGLVLVGMAAGALAASPLAGRAVGRVGSRPVAVGAAVALGATLWTAGAAPHPVLLFAALAAIGAADAAMDIAMNANGAAYERGSAARCCTASTARGASGRSPPPASPPLLAAAGVSLTWHLLGVGIVDRGSALWPEAWLVADDHLPDRHPRRRARVRRSPGGAAAVPPQARTRPGGAARTGRRPARRPRRRHRGGRRHRGRRRPTGRRSGSNAWAPGPGRPALGFAAFTAGMLAGRLAGDRLTDRHGGAAVLRGGMALVAVGLLAGVAGRPPGRRSPSGLVVAGVGRRPASSRSRSRPRPPPRGPRPARARPRCRWRPGSASWSSRVLDGRARRSSSGCGGRSLAVAALAVAVAVAARARAGPHGPDGRRRRGHRRRSPDRLTGAGRAPPRPPNARVPYDRPIVGATPALAERPGAGDAPPARPRPRRDLLTPAAVALTLVPLAVMAVHVLRSDVFPIGDLATTEMLTRDVGAHSPSLGPYSRDGLVPPRARPLLRAGPPLPAPRRRRRRAGGRGPAHQRRVGRRHGRPRRGAVAGPVAAARHAGGLRAAAPGPGADAPGDPVERLRHGAPVRGPPVPGLGRVPRRPVGAALATLVATFLSRPTSGSPRRPPAVGRGPGVDRLGGRGRRPPRRARRHQASRSATRASDEEDADARERPPPRTRAGAGAWPRPSVAGRDRRRVLAWLPPVIEQTSHGPGT